MKEVLTEQLDIKGLLLAHELFHFVEEKYKDEILQNRKRSGSGHWDLCIMTPR